MSAITNHVIGDVSGKLGFGLMAAHLAISDTLEGVRIQRAQAADSVSELAVRLQEARRDQNAAEARAASAEARLVLMERALNRASAEAAALRESLSVEREFTAGLREILGH